MSDVPAFTGRPEVHRKERAAFEALYAEWHRLLAEYSGSKTPDERCAELDEKQCDLELAWQIIAALVPLGFMMARSSRS